MANNAEAIRNIAWLTRALSGLIDLSKELETAGDLEALIAGLKTQVAVEQNNLDVATKATQDALAARMPQSRPRPPARIADRIIGDARVQARSIIEDAAIEAAAARAECAQQVQDFFAEIEARRAEHTEITGRLEAARKAAKEFSKRAAAISEG